MHLKLYKSVVNSKSHIQITGSKSESNRLLLLQALYPQISIDNLSNSDDSRLMQKALESKEELIDIHHAGTAMRFLTAYFSIQENRDLVITGSSRMKERPIKILVNALKRLGADIQYTQEEGFPPLKIKGKTLLKHRVKLAADVSSQYISALILIASKLEHGLEIILDDEITSVPYINMSLTLLNQIGIETHFKKNKIKIEPCTSQPKPQNITVESDWSSASYFYSIVALSKVGTEITLSSYKKKSLQGDSVLAEIYQKFGVKTTFVSNAIKLQKSKTIYHQYPINLDLSNAPDIAQTIIVTAFGLGIECKIIGLHTLKIKETDRLVALKSELEKLSALVEITPNSLHIEASKEIHEDCTITTYNDHRMAMAFAPLALKTSLTINDAEVVSKSYPQFWEDLKTIGFKIQTL